MLRACLVAFICLSKMALASHPFPYDLQLTQKPGKHDEVMIVAHGMSGSYKHADTLSVEKTLISFNFPDYDYGQKPIEAKDLTFGTPDEILPLLYVIKKSVINDGLDEIDLYGFSAGGGAVINALAALNTMRFSDKLKHIGINQEEREKMLKAIQKGQIVLHCPLKSIREIIAFKGLTPQLEVVQKNYRDNGMEPIDALECLNNLSLNIVLYFNSPDEILSNRDDTLYYERLKGINAKGTTVLITGYEKGHNSNHPLLWDALKQT